MPSTAPNSQLWEGLDRALLVLDLEELLLVFPLRFVNRWDDDLNQEVVGVNASDEMQMKTKIQTWFLESCLPESGKRYFGCDDPLENSGMFIFEWESLAKYSSIRLEAPSL